MTRKLTILFGSLLLFSAIGLNATFAEESTDTYFLLNVESYGVLTARDLVFTNAPVSVYKKLLDL